MEWAFGQPGVVLLASCDLQAARRPREWAAARLLLALRRGSSNSSAGLAGSGLGDSSDPAAPGQKVTRLCLGSSPGAGGGGSRRVNPSRSQAPGGALGPGCEASRPQAGGQTVPPPRCAAPLRPAASSRPQRRGRRAGLPGRRENQWVSRPHGSASEQSESGPHKVTSLSKLLTTWESQTSPFPPQTLAGPPEL